MAAAAGVGKTPVLSTPSFHLTTPTHTNIPPLPPTPCHFCPDTRTVTYTYAGHHKSLLHGLCFSSPLPFPIIGYDDFRLEHFQTRIGSH